jgi:hypothetical protein
MPVTFFYFCILVNQLPGLIQHPAIHQPFGDAQLCVSTSKKKKHLYVSESL